MKQQSVYDIGYGFCRYDSYQKPIIRNERYYCPVCGERMRQRPRTRPNDGLLDSRPRE